MQASPLGMAEATSILLPAIAIGVTTRSFRIGEIESPAALGGPGNNRIACSDDRIVIKSRGRGAVVLAFGSSA